MVRVRHLMFGGVALGVLLAWIQWAAPGEEGRGQFPAIPLLAATVFLVAAFSPAGARPLADDPASRTRLAILAGGVVLVVVGLVVGFLMAAGAE